MFKFGKPVKNSYRLLLVIHLLLIAIIPVYAQSPDLTVLDYWPYYQQGASDQLYRKIVNDALDKLKAREQRVESLKGLQDWKAYQADVRTRLKSTIGDFPAKTPLNPVITGKIEREDFTVEKILLESRPSFHLTGAFFKPKKGPRKKATVIYCSGHTPLAFRSETYQRVILNLVAKGFNVFAFDPIGQGERIHYLDENEDPAMGPTHQHSYPGAQAYLAGSSLTKYFIWDGIRVVDYLVSRPDVDPERLGITGRSGGGTQSAQIAAFEARILAAAPENYITGYEYLLKSRGPQDAEQNFPDFLAHELDHADLIEVRAPKPYLISATTRDIFSIQGVRNTVNEVKRMYEAFQAVPAFSYTVDDAVHESTLLNREATYAFLMNHLAVPGDPDEVDVKFFTPEELQVTPTGQVLTAYNGLSTQELIARDLEGKSQVNLKEKIKQLVGYQEDQSPSTTVFSGRTHTDGLIFEEYLLEDDLQTVIPLVVIYDSALTAGNEAVVMLSDSGKASIPMEWIREQTSAGKKVVLADLPGIGEAGPGYLQGDSYIDRYSYNQWFGSILTGKSIIAYQMNALDRVDNFCKEKLQTSILYGIAKGGIGLTLLHQQYLNQPYEKIALYETPDSYREMVLSPDYHPAYVWYWVEGAARWYEPRELLSEENVNWIRPVGPEGEVKVDDEEIVNDWFR